MAGCLFWRRLAYSLSKLKRIGGSRELLDRYLKITVLEFDNAAAAEFERLQRLRLRVGTMDLKIAAIALAHQATVLTRNRKDFDQMPNLRVEDWTE